MKRPIICSECAFDTAEVEVVGHTVKEHWYCAYSRPEYGHVKDYSACEYYEPSDDEEFSE